MPAPPVPYLKAWVAFVVGSLVVVIPGGAIAGAAFFFLMDVLGQRDNWQFLDWAAPTVQTAAAVPLSYLTFKFVVQTFILPAAYARSRPNPQPATDPNSVTPDSIP